MPDPAESRYQLKTRWARHNVVDTEFGCTSGSNRPAEEDTTYWRMAHFLFPFYAMIPGSFAGNGFIVVVPVDDENCVRFTMNVKGQSISRRGGGGPGAQWVDGINTGYAVDPHLNTSDWLGRFRMAGNRRNDYLIDREIQKAGQPGNGGIGYSGIPGRGQDGAVTESMGIIYQRDREHLGVTDNGIIRMRRLFIKHARALRDHGTLPPAVDRPELYRVQSVAVVLPNGVNGMDATKDRQYEHVNNPPQLATTV